METHGKFSGRTRRIQRQIKERTVRLGKSSAKRKATSQPVEETLTVKPWGATVQER